MYFTCEALSCGLSVPSSCYNCGGLDHHAKECGLPPQPKKCHYCQSITHMVAQCPQKALAPPSGSQDQHASTSASSPGAAAGPYLCPPEEEERSGSSPLEGSSSSPEEPHTHRGPRTQRWRKYWTFSSRSIKHPSSTSHLWTNGRSQILYFCFICCFSFLTSAAMATIIGVRTCMNVCNWSSSAAMATSAGKMTAGNDFYTF